MDHFWNVAIEIESGTAYDASAIQVAVILDMGLHTFRAMRSTGYTLSNLAAHRLLMLWAKGLTLPGIKPNLSEVLLYKSALPFLGASLRRDGVIPFESNIHPNHGYRSWASSDEQKRQRQWYYPRKIWTIGRFLPERRILSDYPSKQITRRLTNQVEHHTKELQALLPEGPWTNELGAHLLNSIERTYGAIEYFGTRAISGSVLAYEDSDVLLCAAVATRSLDLPLIVVSHGLDCEPYVFDLSLATTFFCWGEWTRSRLIGRVGNIKVVGNWNILPEPRTAARQRAIGYVTRPHTAFRCRYPEYSPRQGICHFVESCEFAARAKAKLIIRRHPGDFAELYTHIISERRYANVSFHRGTIQHFSSSVDFAICEDSTAAIDIAYHGCPIVVLGPAVIPYDEHGVQTHATRLNNVAPQVPSGLSRFYKTCGSNARHELFRELKELVQ